MEIMDSRLTNMDSSSNKSEIEGVESMYKKVTSLVSGIEKTIKRTTDIDSENTDLNRNNYIITNELVSIFQKFNSNDEYLELQHSLTKDILSIESARKIRMLYDIS